MTMSDEALVFPRVPPQGFTVPGDVVELLRARSRSDYVLDHGPTREEVKPGWWAKQGIEIAFPSTIDGQARLTRRDLFAMADEAEAGDGEALLRFLWHTLAWGSADSRRNNLQRITNSKANVATLRSAFEAARTGNPHAAYGSLIRPGRAAIPRLGPAFFSKFLYFASAEASPRCLILDARVARSLFRRGWSMAPTYPTRTFSYNWYTDTYAGYCDLLADWAQQAGDGVTADMLERALFEQGKG